MGIIRCEQPCRYQKDGYCRLDHPAQINRREALKTGCAFFAKKKEG